MNTNTEAVLDGLRNINITTDDRDYAAITFDATKKIEKMDSRITQLENQWISVKDRLPDVDDFIIANFRNRPNFIARAWKFTVHNKEGAWCKYTGGEVTLIKHNTHWMPLPSPPKEQVK